MGVVIPHAKPAAAKAPDIASLPIPDTLAALHVSVETGYVRKSERKTGLTRKNKKNPPKQK